MNFDDNKLKEIFFNNPPCDCFLKDCSTNHRACGICGKKMQFNEYFGYIDYDTDYLWDIDHIQLISFDSSTDEIKNLQAAHPWCIKKKRKKL